MRVWLGEWDLFFEWNAFLLSYSREVLYKYQYRWRDVQSCWYIFSKYIEHHKGKKQIKKNYCYLKNNGVIITPLVITLPAQEATTMFMKSALVMSRMFPLMVSIISESAFNLLDQRTVSFFTFISSCMTYSPEMGGFL